MISLIELNTRQWGLLFFLTCLLLHTSITKADEGSFGYRVFKMQEKQANKGNSLAQFKLGTFYEFGISVKPDTNEAIKWYKKSAQKKNKAAIDRLTYLDIKQNGYKKSTHSKWLNKSINGAKFADANNMIVLGQLYHYGLGVKTDLKKALSFLQKASSVGHAEIQSEINIINKKLNPEVKKPEKIDIEPQKIVTKEPVKKAKAKTSKKKKIASKKKKTSAKKKKANAAALKRQRYNEAMRKLHRETVILQQQQEWTEDEDGDGEEED